MKKATFLLLSLSTLVLSLGFEVTLDKKQDLTYGWKFSKNRQFLYFDTTEQIPPLLIPVKIDNLPERTGVWLLRHKDFVELPDTFSGLEEDAQKPASIGYSSSAVFFYSIKVKAFIFGNVNLNLLTNAGQGEQSLKKGYHHPKVISLGGEHYKNCSKTNDAESDSDFRWVTYEIQTTGASKMELHVKIDSQKSFILLDEIAINYNDPTMTWNAADVDNVDEKYQWSGEKITVDSSQGPAAEGEVSSMKKMYRVHCFVDE